MSEAIGISRNLLFDMLQDKSSNSEQIQVLRARFETYVHTYGRAAITEDLAKPPHLREIVKIPEMADCAQMWLDKPTSFESSERMTKVLMVAAVIECAVTISFNIVPWLT